MATLAVLLYYGIQVYIYIIIVYIIMGYFHDARRFKFYQILEDICEPLLNVFRFASISGISFAPILAIFVLTFIQRLIQIIYGV